ncbi:MAG: hypothetical protein U0105_04780 [Candidatus Obscuribacterales bacterium]
MRIRRTEGFLFFGALFLLLSAPSIAAPVGDQAEGARSEKPTSASLTNVGPDESIADPIISVNGRRFLSDGRPDFGFTDSTDAEWDAAKLPRSARVFNLVRQDQNQNATTPMVSMLIDATGSAHLRLRDCAGLHMFQLTQTDATKLWGKPQQSENQVLQYSMVGLRDGSSEPFEMVLKFENNVCITYRLKGGGIKSDRWMPTGVHKKGSESSPISHPPR